MRASKVTHIDAHVDPRRLPAGVVVAAATDPGYGSILAAQDLGIASPLGISYDPAGNQYVAAFVSGRGTLRPNIIAGRVEIGARFFTNAWKDYGYSWATCWWREALQNSIDGGARNIDCSVTEVTLPSGAKAYDVVVEDDGRGMTLDILQNKFLHWARRAKRSASTSTASLSAVVSARQRNYCSSGGSSGRFTPATFSPRATEASTTSTTMRPCARERASVLEWLPIGTPRNTI